MTKFCIRVLMTKIFFVDYFKSPFHQTESFIDPVLRETEHFIEICQKLSLLNRSPNTFLAAVIFVR